MIINGRRLLAAAPIKDMLDRKVRVPDNPNGVSHGLTECGYDLRIAEDVAFFRGVNGKWYHKVNGSVGLGRKALVHSLDYFQMPDNMMGKVLNKSTWARKWIDASRTTNIEPGWRGHLTIELVYDAEDHDPEVSILSGQGICQVMFEEIAEPAQYEGKYQDQPAAPVQAITA